MNLGAMKTIYLSFAKPTKEGGFQGGVFVSAPDFESALDKVNSLGINPGGAVAAAVYPPVRPEIMNRVLSQVDLEKEFGGIVRGSNNSPKAPPFEAVACSHCNQESKPEKAN